jgi:hydroxymethylbilane synthase
MDSSHIIAGARRSPLSQAQLQEVLQEIQTHHPEIAFQPVFVDTKGDRDQKTSLRTLDKTDFFTKELDDMLLTGKIHIAIHSAKDLPEPLPQGLCIAAITRGLDPSDSLVLRQGERLQSLVPDAIVATSSERREEAVRQLRSDLRFVDLRGTIADRLVKLDKGEADGVVVAECALIRLGLTHLNRIRLPGNTVPMQGQLAIVVREDDSEMRTLFSCIDSRASLYLGLDMPALLKEQRAIHLPIIRIVPRDPLSADIQGAFKNMHEYTHLVFTSKSAVRIFMDFLPVFRLDVKDLKNKHVIAVGRSTASVLYECGLHVDIVASDETAEGVTQELNRLQLQHAYFLWPHSALSRTVLNEYMENNHLRYRECVLYDTVPLQPSPPPLLTQFKEIIFTSPSTVDAFKQIYGTIPKGIKLTSIGPVTQTHLVKTQSS